MQTAWNLSTRGCLWTRYRPTIFRIAYSIIRTCRGFEKSDRTVFPARFYLKTSNGLLHRSPSGPFIELNAGPLDLIEVLRCPNPYSAKGGAKVQAELR